jgi:hypothetical protein
MTRSIDCLKISPILRRAQDDIVDFVVYRQCQFMRLPVFDGHFLVVEGMVINVKYQISNVKC